MEGCQIQRIKGIFQPQFSIDEGDDKSSTRKSTYPDAEYSAELPPEGMPNVESGETDYHNALDDAPPIPRKSTPQEYDNHKAIKIKYTTNLMET